MTPLLSLTNVTKEYKMDGVTFVALKGVSLTVRKGEFVAIMGPSGSGKSTLMHIVGCLDRPTAGTVKLEGKNVSRLDDQELARIRNAHVGFVFQQFNLLRRTPAIANVELPLIYSHMNASERREKAREYLKHVGLADKQNNFPSQLSGGQQQRVAIARALVTNPSLILADEPTGNLDSKSGQEIMKLLEELHKDGKTIVLVTHEQDIADHARRIIRIADGNIVSDRKK